MGEVEFDGHAGLAMLCVPNKARDDRLMPDDLSTVPDGPILTATTPHIPTFNSLLPQRYKLTLAYRGTHYHGWQTQPYLKTYKGQKPPAGQGLPTIQEILKRRDPRGRQTPRHRHRLLPHRRPAYTPRGQVCQFDTDINANPPRRHEAGHQRSLAGRHPRSLHRTCSAPIFDSISWTVSKPVSVFDLACRRSAGHAHRANLASLARAGCRRDEVRRVAACRQRMTSKSFCQAPDMGGRTRFRTVLDCSLRLSVAEDW